MRNYMLMIVVAVCLSGCANKKTNYYVVNCSNKTVRPPTGDYSKIELTQIKKKINHICLRGIGLVTLTEKDLAELK